MADTSLPVELRVIIHPKDVIVARFPLHVLAFTEIWTKGPIARVRETSPALTVKLPVDRRSLFSLSIFGELGDDLLPFYCTDGLRRDARERRWSIVQ